MHSYLLACSNIPNRSTFVCPFCGARNLDQQELVKHCMENHRNDPNKVVRRCSTWDLIGCFQNKFPSKKKDDSSNLLEMLDIKRCWTTRSNQMTLCCCELYISRSSNLTGGRSCFCPYRCAQCVQPCHGETPPIRAPTFCSIFFTDISSHTTPLL